MLSTWKKWLAKFQIAPASSASRRWKKRRARFCRPFLEALEDRLAPAAVVVNLPGPSLGQEFPVPAAFANPSTLPSGITAGPNGNLWFTETGADLIGEINPTTHALTEFHTGGSASITSVSLANNIATLTTSTPHGFVVGESIVVAGLANTSFDGSYLLTAVTSTTFSFNLSGANLSTTTDSGTASSHAPVIIVSGPNGNLWFTESVGVFDSNTTTFTATYLIGEINPAGQIISDTPLPGPAHQGGLTIGLTAGPDGNLWFTDPSLNKVGVLNASTHAISEFALPGGTSFLSDITTGPDGNLWFGIEGNLGAFNPGTQTLVGLFPLASSTDLPSRITKGPDGNLWFADYQGTNGDLIGTMNPTSHNVHSFSLPSAGIQLGGITAGPDGNLWFTEYFDPNATNQAGHKIGVITPLGQVIAEIPTLTAVSSPLGITTGPDGNLWFTEQNAGQIGVALPAQPTPSPTEGNSVSFAMGSFSDANAGATSWTAVVNWGDGSHAFLDTPTMQGTLGRFPHIYNEGGHYTVTVTVTDNLSDPNINSGSMTFPVTVQEPKTTLSVPTSQQINLGQTANLNVLFTDPDAGENAAGDAGPDNNVNALINWGDQSTPTQETILYQGVSGQYTIPASHTYTTAGVFTILIRVTTVENSQAFTFVKMTVVGLLGNGLIAFSSNRNGFYDIYTGSVGSTTFNQLTHAASSSVVNSEPVFSPDGSSIAFSSNQDDLGHRQIYVYVMQPNGSHLLNRLTNDPFNDSAPVWSPDGSSIAFVSDRSGYQEIWVMKAVSGDTVATPAVQLTTLKGFSDSPAWSSGNQIAFQFQAQLGNDHKILVQNLTTSGATVQPNGRPLVLTSPGDNIEPAWSPDGTKIVFASAADQHSNYQIFSIGPTGLGLTNLSKDAYSDRAPAWSPDGTQIGFSSTHGAAGGHQSIYTMNADGTSPALLVQGSISQDYSEPDWQTVQRPLNDDFSQATPFAQGLTPLTLYSGTVFGSNVNATKRTGNFLNAEPNEPDHAGNPGGRSVWFKWTTADDGVTTMNTSGSVFTTQGSDNRPLMQVYTNVDPATGKLDTGKLFPVTGKFGSLAAAIGASSVAFDSYKTSTYYVAVDGFNDGMGGGAASGVIHLNWSFAKKTLTPVEVLNSITPSNVSIALPQSPLLLLAYLASLKSTTPTPYQQITFNGSNFTDQSQVFTLIGGKPQQLGTVASFYRDSSGEHLQWKVPLIYLAGLLAVNDVQQTVTLYVGTPGATPSAGKSFTFGPPAATLASISPTTLNPAQANFNSSSHTITLTGTNFTANSVLYVANGTGAYQAASVPAVFDPADPTHLTWTVPGSALQGSKTLFVGDATHPVGTPPGKLLTVAVPIPLDFYVNRIVADTNSTIAGHPVRNVADFDLSLIALKGDFDNQANGAKVLRNDVVNIVRRDVADLLGKDEITDGFLRLDQDGATFYQDRVVGVPSTSQLLGWNALKQMLIDHGFANNGVYTMYLESRQDGNQVGILQLDRQGRVFLIDGGGISVVGWVLPADITNDNSTAKIMTTDGLYPLNASQAASAIDPSQTSETILGKIRLDQSGVLNLIANDGSSLITNDRSTFQKFASLVSHDGGTLVATGGGNLVATGGGNLVATGGGNLVSHDGGTFGSVGVSQDGTAIQLISHLVSHDGGTFGSIRLGGASHVVSNDGGSLQISVLTSLISNITGESAFLGTLTDNFSQVLLNNGTKIALKDLNGVISNDGGSLSLISEKGGGLQTIAVGTFLGSLNRLSQFDISQVFKNALISQDERSLIGSDSAS